MQYTHPLWLTLVVMTWFSSAHATKGSGLNHDIFLAQCRRFRANRVILDCACPPIGVVTYQPTIRIQSTQNQYSFWKMRESLSEATAAGSNNYYDKTITAWRFAHDPDEQGLGRSLFDVDKYLIAVWWRGHIFHNDGTHKGLMSSYHHAPTVPVVIEEDLSELEFDKFIEWLRQPHENHRLSYWRNHWGEEEDPRDLGELRDDSNMLLARKLMRRVVTLPGAPEVASSKGQKKIIAIKINRHHHLEIRIANALRRRDIEFDPRRREDKIPTGELVKMLDILRRDQDRPGSELRDVLLLDKPREWDKVDASTLIANHVRDLDCAHLLEAPTRPTD